VHYFLWKFFPLLSATLSILILAKISGVSK
jgi:hypothetical protein